MRTENVFLPRPGTDEPHAFIDFQIAAESIAAVDVAYAITMNIGEVSPEKELRLMAAYYDALIAVLPAETAAGYSFTNFAYDYVNALIILVFKWGCTGDDLKKSMERNPKVLGAFFERLDKAQQRWQCSNTIKVGMERGAAPIEAEQFELLPPHVQEYITMRGAEAGGVAQPTVAAAAPHSGGSWFSLWG